MYTVRTTYILYTSLIGAHQQETNLKTIKIHFLIFWAAPWVTTAWGPASSCPARHVTSAWGAAPGAAEGAGPQLHQGPPGKLPQAVPGHLGWLLCVQIKVIVGQPIRSLHTKSKQACFNSLFIPCVTLCPSCLRLCREACRSSGVPIFFAARCLDWGSREVEIS